MVLELSVIYQSGALSCNRDHCQGATGARPTPRSVSLGDRVLYMYARIDMWEENTEELIHHSGLFVMTLPLSPCKGCISSRSL